MQLNRRIIAIAAGATVVAAGGVGIAYGVGGDDEQVTGSNADKAEAAAVKAAGGGTVSEVEHRDGDGGGAYEVEVTRADGSQVEIHLDGAFKPVGTAADDDSRSESEDEDKDD